MRCLNKTHLYETHSTNTPVCGLADATYLPAKTYRPLATRTNRGEEPDALVASAPLIEDHATDWPSDASTAAWISLARIGSPRSVSTWMTAWSTQP